MDHPISHDRSESFCREPALYPSQASKNQEHNMTGLDRPRTAVLVVDRQKLVAQHRSARK
jgi:hypothetical protein